MRNFIIKNKLIVFFLFAYMWSWITMTGILSPSYSFSSQTDDIKKTIVSVSVLCTAAILVVIFSKTMRKKSETVVNGDN